MVGCLNVFSDQALGRVYQKIPHDLCHGVWVGGDVVGGGWCAHGEGSVWGVPVLGRGEDGGDGVQPVGGLVD